MQKSYTDYINAAFDVFDQTMPIYVQARLEVIYGYEWFAKLPENINSDGEDIHWDTQAILNTMLKNWHDVFHTELDFEGKNLIGELKGWRNRVSHRSAKKTVTFDDADRAVDSVWRLLSLIPVPQVQEVRAIKDELRAGDAPVSVPQEPEAPQPNHPLPVSQGEPDQQEPKPVQPSHSPSVSQGEPTVTYNFSRFCFKANLIEPLENDQAFRVVTPKGTFQMTKAEFHKAFPKVVVSKSYAENGIYHYPAVPKSAMPYLLSD